MGYLSAQDEAAVTREFEKLTGPVTLTVFASELGPENNAQTVSLIKEVGALSEKITVKVMNPHIEREEAAAYGVSDTPAVAFHEDLVAHPAPLCASPRSPPR